MKIIIFFLGILLAFQTTRVTEPIKAMSFNIRYGTANDGDNSWTFRKDLVFDLIRDENCDFVGLQESMQFQIDEIMEAIPGYHYVGRSRELDPKKGESTPILYKSDSWKLLDSQTLWLSESPEVPASKSWDAALPRIFTWAKFENNQSTDRIVVYNTHFDHMGHEAREESAKIIVAHMQNHFANDRILLLGDLNASEADLPITYLTKNETYPMIDPYRTIHPEKSDRDVTFYGWKVPPPGEGNKIDYIFINGGLQTIDCYVNDYNLDGRFPSDHLPVIGIFNSNSDKN